MRSFDPEYDDPFGAGWIISDEYWADSPSNIPEFWLGAEGNIDWDASAYEAQEYARRWDELEHLVHIETAAALHTMNLLMGRAAPPALTIRQVAP